MQDCCMLQLQSLPPGPHLMLLHISFLLWSRMNLCGLLVTLEKRTNLKKTHFMRVAFEGFSLAYKPIL